MPRFLDRLFDLGPSVDVRRVAVGTKIPGQRHEIVSTSGARVKLCRGSEGDAEVQKALLWLVRAGVLYELAAGEPGIWLGGERVSLEGLVARGRGSQN